jgi:acyl dehydratase
MHTLAIFQRLSVLAAERNWAVIAGVEMRNVKFKAPVVAGAVLTGRLRVDRIELEPERSRGLLRKTGWLYDGDRCVVELTSDAYLRTRGPVVGRRSRVRDNDGRLL